MAFLPFRAEIKVSMRSSPHGASVHRTLAVRLFESRSEYQKSQPQRAGFSGAADGTRPRTVSLPGDFKSPVSTDSTTAAAGDYDTIFLFYRQDCFGEDGNHCFAEMTDRNFNVFCILSVDMLNQMCYNIPQECHLTEEKL